MARDFSPANNEPQELTTDAPGATSATAAQPPLILRDALASDKQPILEFCHQTWDWGDYIEGVWDDWFNDQHGGLRVGEVDGKPVGVNKLTMLSADEGWLEGMRLNPDYRGRGYTYQFMSDVAQLAEQRGAAALRLATASSNVPIQKVAERLGLRRAAVFTPYNAEGLSLAAWEQQIAPDKLGLAERLRSCCILEAVDAAAVWQHIEGSPLRSASAGLYADGWAWAQLTEEKLHKRLRSHQVIACLDPQHGNPHRRPYLPALAEAEEYHARQGKKMSIAASAIRALAVISGVNSSGGLEVGYVDYAAQPDGSDDDDIEAIALALRLSAGSLTPARVSIMLPNEATLEIAFERAGFNRDFEEGQAMYVYEKRFRGES